MIRLTISLPQSDYMTRVTQLRCYLTMSCASGLSLLFVSSPACETVVIEDPGSVYSVRIPFEVHEILRLTMERSHGHARTSGRQ